MTGKKDAPVKVLIAIGLEEALVEQVRAVDPCLEVTVLDRDAAWLLQGRPLPPKVDAEAAPPWRTGG